MTDLTLEQVMDAGLPATRPKSGNREFTVDYLPGNRPKERFRVWGGEMTGTMFGPGGEHTPADGWQHKDGCECEFCGALAY